MRDSSDSNVQLTLPSGRQVTGFLAKPTQTPAPALLMIHEWWGLNEEMRDLAREYAAKGFVVLACDLFEGQSTADPAMAKQLMTSLDISRASETVVAWVGWLRNSRDTNGKVGALGFCMGGAWALNVSLLTPVDATVVYYGSVSRSAEQLSALQGPLLGHFGKRDKGIAPPMVHQFEAHLAAARKNATIHFYDADHAFSRQGGPNYDAASAELARKRTLKFLAEHLN